MKKRSTGFFPILAYIVYIVAGWALAHDMKVNHLEEIKEVGGIGAAFAGIAVTVIISFASAYAVIAIIPLILKGVHLATRLGLFGVFCMLFDLVYSFVHGALLYNCFVDPTVDGSAKIVYAVLFVISVSALFTNAKSVSK